MKDNPLERQAFSLKSKTQSAKEIAEIMAMNMAANMKDPDFWKQKEERLQKARDAVLKDLRKKEKKEE